MTQERIKLTVINNALCQAPIWNEHRRAKNWAAVIDIDGTAPGGLSRRFLPYGRGPVFYLVEQVALFDALEFAADQLSYSGNKTPNRWFGVVVERTDDFFTLEPFESAMEAIAASKAKRTSKEDVVRALTVERKHLIARADAVAAEIASIETKPPEETKS